MDSRTAPGIPQASRGLILPVVIFLTGFSLYLASAAGAVLAGSLALKITLAALSGAFIANLAIIGHDAVHRSFTRIRWPTKTTMTTAAANSRVSSRISSWFTGSARTTITNGCSSMICPTRAMPILAMAALKTKNALYWLTRPT